MAITNICSAAELFDRYSPIVYRRCRQMLSHEEQAKDAVREVFLKILDREEAFRGECTPLTWIYRIATNYCLQQLRNSHRRQNKIDQLKGEKTINSTMNPEGQAALQELFSFLSESEQFIAYCRFIDDMTLEEVAEVSGLSRKTVAKKLSHIQKELQQQLNTKTRGESWK